MPESTGGSPLKASELDQIELHLRQPVTGNTGGSY